MRGQILKCITVEGREKQQKVKKDRERERGGKKSEWNVESFYTKLRQNIKFQFATKKYAFRSKEGVAINAFNFAPVFFTFKNGSDCFVYTGKKRAAGAFAFTGKSTNMNIYALATFSKTISLVC